MQNKAKKVGRPKLPKGAAKGSIVQVRFAKEDFRSIAAVARAKKKSVSEWVRWSLPLAGEARHKGYLIELATRPARESGFTTSGWVTNEKAAGEPIPIVPPGNNPTKEAALQFGFAWCKERIDLGNTNDAKAQ